MVPREKMLSEVEKLSGVVGMQEFIKALPFVKRETIIDVMKARLNGKKAQMLEGNIQALEKGFAAVN